MLYKYIRATQVCVSKHRNTLAYSFSTFYSLPGSLFFLQNYEIAPDLCYNVWKLCYLVAVTNSWLFFVTLNMNSSV